MEKVVDAVVGLRALGVIFCLVLPVWRWFAGGAKNLGKSLFL